MSERTRTCRIAVDASKLQALTNHPRFGHVNSTRAKKLITKYTNLRYQATNDGGECVMLAGA